MIAKYLYKNLLWQFNQNPFAHLLGPATTEQQYYTQLEQISDKYFPFARPVDTTVTEFCLNKIALSRAKTAAEKAALSYFGEQWAQYIRIKKLLDKEFLRFPSDTTATRIEQIAQLLCKCTQCAADNKTLERMLCKTVEMTELTERERRYLEDVVRLYSIKYYCAAVCELFDKKEFAEARLARMLKPTLLRYDFSENKRYTQSAYVASEISSVVNCMGSSAVRFENAPAYTETGLFVYSNGRNVFDTFVQSKFGQRHAQFRSATKTVELSMRYFVTGNREIRSYLLSNTGKHKRKFTVKFTFRNTAGKNAEYFKMGNALCLATDIFSALAIVADCSIRECRGERELMFDVTLDAGESYRFDAVTLYAHDSPTLAETLQLTERIGATLCPYLWDGACSRVNVGGTPLVLTSHGYTPLKPQNSMSRQVSFNYQLGNCDVASFADNSGVCTTLLQGFVFGVRGESVYSVQNGLATKLNERAFRLEGDKLVYEKSGARLCICHEKGKVYDAVYDKPAQTLFYFPLEKTSRISFDKLQNCFTVKDSLRCYTVRCFGEVESFTDNALECNEEKLRYKLSGKLGVGNCLAICFARATHACLIVQSANETPAPTPLIHESLVSTYLNYVNDKSVFCLNNYLKRPDCLTVAAICYTNPQYVKNYLQTTLDNGTFDTFYYDAKGETRAFCDRLTLPLAVVYYCNLVGELPAPWLKKANEILFDKNFEGKELCIKALILLKAAKLACFDKVKCLVEYGSIKRQICGDNKLYPYAQAIGALPLTSPSKERLKDLCNRYEIPKSWYYVSQLENLYGLNLSAGKLQISPKVSAENVLEQFALTIAGKRIDTTFAKASVQCMTLNGQQCFAPFYAPSLKNENNELIVNY